MIDNFFRFDECIEQFSMIYQLNSAKTLERIRFNIFEQYIHIYRRLFKILTKLQIIDLYVNINKCEFEHQMIKYLKFIVEAEQNIKMNFEKTVVICQ